MTSDQETRVLAMLAAFEAGKKISDLDTASGSVSDMRIEVLDTDGESKVMNLSEAVTTAANAVCGRYWNESNSTYRAAGYHGSLDMLRKLPELLGLGCYLVQDDRTRRKLDPTNHYRFEDGTPAKLDGTMGQYMWCWNIGFYFAEWKVGNLKYYAVSLSPIKGKQCVYIPAGGLSALGGGVMDRTNNILCSVVSDAAQYRGGNNDASRDGTYRTQLGMVATNMQYRNFSTYARKRGEGWDANWYVAQAVVEILFMIIFGTRNMQEAVIAEKDSNGLYQGGLGSGTTNMPNWDQWGYYPIVPTSAGIELGDGCGETTFNVLKEDGSLHYAAKIPVFFGLKHPFGHIWKIVRGLIDNVGDEKSEVYVAPSLYAGYDDNSISGLIKVCEVPRTSGYIKQKSYYLLCAMPTEIGATASTYFCDYFWESSASSKGLRVRLSGANSGTYAGAFAANTYDAASHSAATVSAPLCFFDADPVMSA